MILCAEFGFASLPLYGPALLHQSCKLGSTGGTHPPAGVFLGSGSRFRPVITPASIGYIVPKTFQCGDSLVQAVPLSSELLKNGVDVHARSFRHSVVQIEPSIAVGKKQTEWVLDYPGMSRKVSCPVSSIRHGDRACSNDFAGVTRSSGRNVEECPGAKFGIVPSSMAAVAEPESNELGSGRHAHQLWRLLYFMRRPSKGVSEHRTELKPLVRITLPRLLLLAVD